MKLIRDKEFLVNRLIPFLVFLIAVYFPVFMHLGNDALGMWDESLFALRALYLDLHGDFLINFNQFEGGNHHPNTKPPLFTIVQALFFRVFGYSELSLRLPVAISVLLILFFMIYYSWKELQYPAIGIFASLVLVTSPGFVTNHISRTGDHDAIIAFLNLLVILYFYKVINSEKQKSSCIWLVALFMTFAVLTKSVAGLFPLPAMVLYALYKKKMPRLLASWHTWAALAMFLLLVSSFYAYSEWRSPGYLLDSWRQDIGGRYVGELLGHRYSWYYYINLLFTSDFVPWLAFIPLSIIAVFTKTGKKYREITFYMLFVALTYLLIISNSSTKLVWYHASMFPLLSMVVGIGIFWLFKTAFDSIVGKKRWIRIMLTIAIVSLIFMYPYIRIIEKVEHPSKDWADEQYGEFIRKTDPGRKYSMVHERFVNTCVIFYAEVLNQTQGKDIAVKNTKSQFYKGEILMCPKNTSWMQDRYEFRIVDEFKELAIIEILDVK